MDVFKRVEDLIVKLDRIDTTLKAMNASLEEINNSICSVLADIEGLPDMACLADCPPI